MKIGICSDIHDNIPNLKKAKGIFEKQKIEEVFFCGDLVSPFTLSFLRDWSWSIKAVFGNNEGDKWGIKRRLEKYRLDQIQYPKKGITWELKRKGTKIVIYHGNSSPVTEALVNCGKYDLVCSGHTHEPQVKRVDKTLWINPGSVTGVSENPKIKSGSVAVYNLETEKAEIIYLGNR